MTHSLFLRIKSLNIKTMHGVSSAKSVIRVAAMHNLREIAAEFGVGVDSHIDPSRIELNYRLRGPETAAGVAELARALLDNAGVKNLRKDAAMALELIFSLPQRCAIEHRVFFAEAVLWADAFFNAPILSAVVHLDEAAPHCHVLVLPLVNGRMNGGKLAGGPSRIRLMQADFGDKVGKRYGLAYQSRTKRLSQTDRDGAGRQILDALKSHPERLNHPEVRQALIAALGQHHESLLPVLGLKLPAPSKAKGKSFAAMMTAPCKPERKNWPHTSIDVHAKSIDVAPRAAPNDLPEIHQSLSCVDVQHSEPSFSPAAEQPSIAASDHQQRAGQAPANATVSGSIEPSSTGKAQQMSASPCSNATIPASPAPDQHQQAQADNASSTTAMPLPGDAGNGSTAMGKSFDSVPTQQRQDGHQDGTQRTPVTQQEPVPSTGIAEGDYIRQRDDDQQSGNWDESRGEFARVTVKASCKPSVLASVHAALDSIGRRNGALARGLQC